MDNYTLRDFKKDFLSQDRMSYKILNFNEDLAWLGMHLVYKTEVNAIAWDIEYEPGKSGKKTWYINTIRYEKPESAS